MDCQNCVFATYNVDKTKQVGCEAGRLEVLKEKDMAKPVLGKPYYELTQFCNMYRTKAWGDKFDTEDLVARARLESMLTFGIVIDIDSDKIDQLNQTLDSIKSIDYPKRGIKVILSKSANSNNVQNCINKVIELQELNFRAKLVAHCEVDIATIDRDDFYTLITQKYSYILKIKTGTKIDSQYFNFINSEVNDSLNMVGLCEDCNNGVLAIHYNVVNSSYIDFANYDLMAEELKKHGRELSNQSTYIKYEKKKQIHNKPSNKTG